MSYYDKQIMSLWTENRDITYDEYSKIGLLTRMLLSPLVWSPAEDDPISKENIDILMELGPMHCIYFDTMLWNSSFGPNKTASFFINHVEPFAEIYPFTNKISCKITPEKAADVLWLIYYDTITHSSASKIFQAMKTKDDLPYCVAEDLNLVLANDYEVGGWVSEVLAMESMKKPIDEFKAGKQKAIGAIVGQVIKASKGKANPKSVKEMITEMIL